MKIILIFYYDTVRFLAIINNYIYFYNFNFLGGKKDNNLMSRVHFEDETENDESDEEDEELDLTQPPPASQEQPAEDDSLSSDSSGKGITYVTRTPHDEHSYQETKIHFNNV